MSLTPKAIGELLGSFGPSPGPLLLDQLAVYLDLLCRWNARTNLTAIRDPEQMVTRHFGESLMAARYLGKARSLLDFGSGAGFPGLPIALSRPDLEVCLGESQHKKASFLREVVRTLGVSVEVWRGRVEDLPADRRFDCITLRAVDDMDASFAEAARRSLGALVVLTTEKSVETLPAISGFSELLRVRIPLSEDRVVTKFVR